MERDVMLPFGTTGAPLRIVGRYAVYHEIAAGGMATVHIGRLLGPVGFARTVAIKRLHPQFAKDPEFVSMFLDEARLAARVQHPNVVPTIDVVATGGELFLVMDYVRGESLSRLVRIARKRKEPVPPRIAASIMCGFLHGLHAAHEATDERGSPLGLVHRDVSPQNVLVGADGIARVLDFGIAKAAGRLQVTMEGQVKGKLAYMPPEQVSGKPLSRAADVYASAVVMWETLTSERLFKGKTEVETLGKILRERVPSPSEVAPGVTTAFDEVLLRALSRDPALRQKTARILSLELERCLGVATSSEVGAWVERLAGPSLDAREAQVADAESQSTSVQVPEEWDSTSDVSAPSHTHTPPETPLPTPTPTPTTKGGTAIFPIPAAARAPDSARSLPPAAPDSSRSLPPAAARPAPAAPSFLAMLAFAVLLVLLAVGTFQIAVRLRRRAAPVPTVSVDAGVAIAPLPRIEEPAPAPPPIDAGVLDLDEVDAAVPAPPPTTRATRRACDPPYTIDVHGRKHYKLECM